MSMKFAFSIGELKSMKASTKGDAEAILDAIESKTEETVVGNLRDAVANALSSAANTVHTKDK